MIENRNILTKEEIDDLVAKRTEYKKAKNFDESDKIREFLNERFVFLHDEGGRTTWHQDLPPDPKEIRFTEPFERDYEFYLANTDKFSFDGDYVIEIPFDNEGLVSKDAFFLYETRGLVEPTKEVELFQKLVKCKGSINLHLKMWVDGVCDGDFTKEEMFSGFVGEVPEWVHISFNNQVLKRCKEQIKKKDDMIEHLSKILKEEEKEQTKQIIKENIGYERIEKMTLIYVKYAFEHNNGYNLKTKEK